MNRQIIEIKGIQGEQRIVSAQPQEVVYIGGVSEAQILVKGKCAKVVIIDAKNTHVFIESIISSVEVTRAKNSLIIVSNGDLISIEQCIECKFGINGTSNELRLRRNTSISLITLPDVNIDSVTPSTIESLVEDAKEHYLPEEIKIEVSKDTIKSSIVTE
ncbi:hypothetical protein NEOKW01_1092 [Nematocida sp. AWRm80]|nr:hypothetical protein NEOKW01_1092 [Nematocida sp. AWRm80]